MPICDSGSLEEYKLRIKRTGNARETGCYNVGKLKTSMVPYSYGATRTLWKIHEKVATVLKFVKMAPETVSIELFFTGDELGLLWIDKIGISNALWHLSLYDEAFVAEAEWETLGEKHDDRLDHGIAQEVFRTAKKALEAWLPVEGKGFLERAIAPDDGIESADWLKIRLTLSPTLSENSYRKYLAAWHSWELPGARRNSKDIMAAFFHAVLKEIDAGGSERNLRMQAFLKTDSPPDVLGRARKDLEIVTAAAFAESFWKGNEIRLLGFEVPGKTAWHAAEAETLGLSLGNGWKDRALAANPKFKYEFPKVFAKESKAVGKKAATPRNAANFRWNGTLEQLTSDGKAVILPKATLEVVSAFFSILQGPGDKIDRADIVDEIAPDAYGGSQEEWDVANAKVRNALNYANEKIRESSGVPDFFEFDKGHVWIRPGAGYAEK